MTERMTPLAAAIFTVLYPAAAAHAQGTAPASTRLEPVVVTATRRDENLQDVAQSVTSVSTEDIEKQAFQHLNDLVGALPSVNIISGTPGRNSIVMRGVSTGASDYRTDSQVAVYLDDQPMSSISQQVDVRLIDIARVEVLPGPQGTLFGSSSQTGTIRYVTNKPDFGGYSGQADIEIGTTKDGAESYDVSGWINIPLSDNFAIRGTAFYSLEGGYVDNVLGTTLADGRTNAAFVEDDFNEYTTTGGRVAARWSISPQWESTLSLIQQSGDSEGSWETDPFLGENKIARFFDEYYKDDWYQASINVKGDLGFAELSLTASYFDRDIVYEWDNMPYDQWRAATYPDTLYDTDGLFGTAFNDQTQNRYAYEARLTSQGDSRFQWMAGAFYEDIYDWWHVQTIIPGLMTTTTWSEATYDACVYAPTYGYDAPCPIPDTDIYYSNIFDKRVRQKAVFGEMTYALTEKWSVTGGARWFEYDRQEFDIYNIPFGLAMPNGRGFGGRYERAGKDEDVVMKLGTEFHFNDDVMGYLLYSEGFRLGGNNSQRAADTGEVPLEYGPDTLKNYEMGIKSEWLDQRLQINASLFYMKWDDIQVNTTTSDPYWLRGTFNAEGAEQKGIEINGGWQVTEKFGLEYSVFLADPEFSEDAYYTNGVDLYIAEGTMLPVSAKEKYWFAADYYFPDFLPWQGDFWTRWSYTYQGETWDSLGAIEDNERQFLIPAWKSSTLQFGFSAESGWDAALIVRNLFDEDSYNGMSQTDRGATFGDPRYKWLRSLQRPRSYSLSFTKKF